MLKWAITLVTIDDAAENTWLDGRIDSYAGGTVRWWIGYNDVTVEGYWDWDGPYSSYINWATNEPNNAQAVVKTVLYSISSVLVVNGMISIAIPVCISSVKPIRSYRLLRKQFTELGRSEFL